MKTKLLFLTIVFVSQLAFANEEIREVLEKAADAYSNEDCVSYSNCFVESSRKSKRRQAGIRFSLNDKTSLSLKEVHLILEEADTAEVAVCYESNFGTISSLIFLSKEDGSWKIKNETNIKNLDAISSDSYSYTQVSSVPFRVDSSSNCSGGLCPTPVSSGGCANGRCGGPNIPFNTLKMCRDYGFDPIPCPR